ncbi:hypothetical protein T439DRAFT_289553 [Meredithblackwellia eburnea MCA 4105]
MSALSLPAPVNGHDSTLESSTTKQAPAATTDSSKSPADEFLDVILPPPEIRSIVDKTAAFVAKSSTPETFEDKIRAKEKTDSRFAFLNKTDAYHAYYQHRLQAFRSGETLDAKGSADAKDSNGAAAQGAEKEDEGPPQPPPREFLVDNPPAINAVDLDILRLTALFTARSGRRFASDLASRESRNYQFDFLRPSHSLFGYFNRLTEQYTKMLIPSKEAMANLERRSGGPPSDRPDERRRHGRQEVLKDAHVRVEWEKWEQSKQQEIEDREEAERIAFAEIDWQDFVIVSTLEFTEADEAGLAELPPPMSLSEVENMTIAQKKMAAMIMEGKEDEIQVDEAEMEMDDDDDDEKEDEEADKERRKAVDIKTVTSNGPMKIRKDYVPKAARPKEKVQQYTTFGGQQVPVEEFSDHVRIELIDPKWKEAQRQSEINRSSANLLPQGANVSNSIRALAAHRPDIFGGRDDAEEKKRQEEAKAKSRAREAEVWDGHTASKEGITNRYQQQANLDEQIEALHRAKGLLHADPNVPQIGPSAPAVDPSAVPPPVPEQPPSFISGATISAAPQPTQTNQSFAATNYTGTSSGYVNFHAPPPGMLPARPAVGQPGEGIPGESNVRPAEDEPEGEPSAKRTKREDGHYYPEEEWIESHPNPITVKVHLPTYPTKPEWGCDGSVISLEEIPLTLLAGVLRDRVAVKVGLPIGKQKLTYKGRILANSTTLAALNFEDGDEVVVSIKDAKKK